MTDEVKLRILEQSKHKLTKKEYEKRKKNLVTFPPSQYDSNGNCFYCGFGPNNRNPFWCEWKNKCTLTHKQDPLKEAKSPLEWKLFMPEK